MLGEMLDEMLDRLTTVVWSHSNLKKNVGLHYRAYTHKTRGRYESIVDYVTVDMETM